MAQATPTLGLRENWPQFTLLVIVNAFVGAMVGLERSVVPLVAEESFGLASRTIILSFLITFGLVKAFANLFAGRLGDQYGRRRVLIAGWLVGLPVPLLIIWAPSWGWVVAANVLLGVNQGLCWSTTVIMKIDLVGPRQRGLAMGLNEFAGYLAVSLSALLTGYLAAIYGTRPWPFVPGILFAVVGLLLSLFFVRETRGFTAVEAAEVATDAAVPSGVSATPSFGQVFYRTSWQNRTLFSISQAGLVNNLNDGMIWGLLPLFLASFALSVERIAILAAVYPGVWGAGQLFTGALSDRLGRKALIAGGMIIQSVAIAMIATGEAFGAWLAAVALLGVGTAMVYPTLLAAISDVAHPTWRGSAVGVYRLWRDSGFAVGALMTGLLADRFGMAPAIMTVAAVTLFSGVIVAMVMRETLPSRSAPA